MNIGDTRVAFATENPIKQPLKTLWLVLHTVVVVGEG